SHCWQ
ncbi:hypothetical protein D049_1847B, partial [Vibrio parahaemolyticus VPTS-2010]